MGTPRSPQIRFIDDHSRKTLGSKRIKELGLSYFQSALREAVKFWEKCQYEPRLAGALISYNESHETMDITIEFVDHFSVSWWTGRGYVNYLDPRGARNRIIENIKTALSDLRESLDSKPTFDYPTE